VQKRSAGVGYEEAFPEQIDEGGKKVAAMLPRTEQPVKLTDGKVLFRHQSPLVTGRLIGGNGSAIYKQL